MIRLLIALLFVSPNAFAEEPLPSTQLQILKEADQADRSIKPIDWSAVSKRDAERRVEVLKIVRAGGLNSDTDYYNAALIFQHGDEADQIAVAHAFSTIAAQLSPENKKAKWLKAASWDRLLMRMNKPQWYGTQYVKRDGKWILYELDESAVTDIQRSQTEVPSLAEAKAFIDVLNKK